MLLRDQLTKDGTWLFRWRSYVPLFIAPLIVVATIHYRYFGGTPAADGIYEKVCLLVSIIGLLVRAHVVAHAAPHSSGGGTVRPAGESLNTTGFYSVVRHPLYLANSLMWLGVALFSNNLNVIIAVCLFFGFYYERIMLAEERYLEGRFGERFVEWAAHTPAFIPRLSGWVPPIHAFDWRALVRRECSALFALVVVFTAIEVGGDWAIQHRLFIEPFWAVIFFGTAIFYATVRVLKKTTLLLVPRGW